jgi:radical SAM protein with 4Fe4S-binding SPASM domain
MDHQLINIKPLNKTKGFQDLKIKKDDIARVYPNISSISPSRNLSSKESLILKKIIKSYEKVNSGIELDQADFVLSGHEINEFNSIKVQDYARYLIYRYKYNKYPELKIVDDFPPCIQIEPSSICNYRCVMCYQIDKSFSNKSTGYMGYMDLDIYKNIIDQIEGKVEAVTLASRGEPLLNKNFIKMLEYSSGKFLGFKINTNASLLTEKLSHTILSNLEIGTLVFSIDAADKKLYEKIRVNGDFDKVLRNISMFKEIKEKYYKDSNIVTRVSGVKINEDQDIEEMENVWLNYVDQTGFTKYTPWQSSYENNINDINSPCTELWRRMFVWQDGIVNPCDYDYKSTLSVGKVPETPISNLWNSNKYKELRESHSKLERSKKSPCNKCPMT